MFHKMQVQYIFPCHLWHLYYDFHLMADCLGDKAAALKSKWTSGCGFLGPYGLRCLPMIILGFITCSGFPLTAL